MKRSEILRNFFQNGGLTYCFCLLSVIILPVYVHYLPAVMIIWVLFWIIENKSGFKKDLTTNNKAAILFFLFMAFFLWQVLGLFLAESLSTGFERLFKRLSFLLFPLVLFCPNSRIIKNIDLIIKLFAICTFIYIVYCFGNALHHSLIIQNHNLIFNPHPSEYDFENYFYGARLSDPVHPSYLAMYIVISALISFESLFDNSITYLKKGVWSSMIVVFITVIYLLSARAGILAAVIVFPIYFLFKFYARYPKWIAFIGLFTFAVILGIVANKNERISSSIEGVSQQNFNETLKNDPRLLIWKSALGVIRKNLILGVGTGDATDKLKEEFISRGYISGYYDNLNAHNQFLEIILENGLIGLILFLGILVYMAYIAINQHNLLLGMFLVTTVIFFIFETMLNRLAGVSFFALFSFLLIYTKQIKQTRQITISQNAEVLNF
jgi:O-antigen ligase